MFTSHPPLRESYTNFSSIEVIKFLTRYFREIVEQEKGQTDISLKDSLLDRQDYNFSLMSEERKYYSIYQMWQLKIIEGFCSSSNKNDYTVPYPFYR